MIFVFGSNEAGIHGAGAARVAYANHGAIYGKGFGLQGDSFAIPTKDKAIRTLSLEAVREYVDKFLAYARAHLEDNFQVTQIGCGLAGFNAKDIAPLFKGALSNCIFDTAWKLWLGERRYWGTHP